MAGLTLVKRRSSVDMAVEQLRRTIIHGGMAPGERITEMELASQLGIGRSTVRTALLELEQDELVTRKPYSAWAVADMDERKIREIYSLRLALEELATGLAIEQVDSVARARLSDAFSRLERAERGELDRTSADLNFHRTIVELSGHSKLLKLYDSLLLQVEWIYRWSERRKPSAIQLVEWHRPIYDSLMRGDAAAAAEATKRNYASASHADLSSLESVR